MTNLEKMAELYKVQGIIHALVATTTDPNHLGHLKKIDAANKHFIKALRQELEERVRHGTRPL